MIKQIRNILIIWYYDLFCNGAYIADPKHHLQNVIGDVFPSLYDVYLDDYVRNHHIIWSGIARRYNPWYRRIKRIPW